MKRTKKIDPDLDAFDDFDNELLEMDNEQEKSRHYQTQRYARQMLARKKLEQLKEDNELNRIIFGDYYGDFTHDETTL